MRIIISLILLSLSFIAHAIPSATIPNQYTEDTLITENMLKRLTESDDLICKVRSEIGAHALYNAGTGVEINKSFAAMTTFILSSQFDELNLPVDELATLNSLFYFAYALHEKYPHVTPQQLKDGIWESCVYEKTAILASLK